MNKNRTRQQSFASGRATLALAAVLGIGAACGNAGARATNTMDAVIQPVIEVLEVIQKYRLPLDPTAASRSIAAALIQQADEGGKLATEAELLQFKEQNQGIVYGPGIEFNTTGGLPRITGLATGMPAAASGISTGALIEKIDSHELLSGMKPESVEHWLRGTSVEPVRLVLRDAAGKTNAVEIPRALIRLACIEAMEDLPNDFCYLKLNGLYEGSAKDIVSALRGWSERDRFGVVLDLRGAGGDDLKAAADIASFFAPAGSMLMALRDAQDQDLHVFKASAGSPIRMPAMVLTDSRTRGAAEALAGLLSESVRGAMLIGNATAGDPGIREFVSLPSGERLYLATRRLVFANGKVMSGKAGLQPDILVSENEDVPDYEPTPSGLGEKKELMAEEKEDKMLRERVRGDAALRRAVEVLLGLKALDFRGSTPAEAPAH